VAWDKFRAEGGGVQVESIRKPNPPRAKARGVGATDIDWDFRHNFPDAGWTGGDVIGKPLEIVDRVLELVIEVDAVRC